MISFNERFKFQPERAFLLGAERECFLTRGHKIVPIAPEILATINSRNDGQYGYELSACQLELRVGPTSKSNFGRALRKSQLELEQLEKTAGFKAVHREVAPATMPLDIFPDPSGRYQQITKNMPKPTLVAACRVAGTHIHVGMESPEQAILCYNYSLHYLDLLCRKGDRSKGQRLEIYRKMAPDHIPPTYSDWQAFAEYARVHGFENDPRKCWHLIRISVHGTLEFRMFGATPNVADIIEWASQCYGICKCAVRSQQ